MPLPDRLIRLLQQPTHLYLTTLLPDGAPHTTMTWVDTDGDHIIVNIPENVQKHRNVLRDPRVSFAVSDAGDQRRYVGGSGHVVAISDDIDHEHIDRLATRYLRTTFAAMGGGPDHRRKRLLIAVDRTHEMG